MIRFKILRALGRLRSNNPRLPIDHRAVSTSIDQNMKAAFRYMRWRHTLEQATQEVPPDLSDHHETLIGLLRDKQTHAVERLFRLMNLDANDEEFSRIYRGFRSRKREARAGSRELVENLVQASLRRPLLRLIDDLYEPSAMNEERSNGNTPTYDAVLGELLVSGIESLSSFAAYLAGKRKVQSLSAILHEVVPLSRSHAGILRATIAALSRGPAFGSPNG